MRFSPIVFCIALLPALLINSCRPAEEEELPLIESRSFGVLQDGREVTEFILRNENGMAVHILDYGGTITQLWVPDREGTLGDVVLGFDNLEEYQTKSPYFGSVIGRYGNRIANGRFTLDSTEYKLAKNNGVNHLHGGLKGFDKVLWEATPSISDSGSSLLLIYKSPHLEEGYPGNLDVAVNYSVSNDNQLVIQYSAMTDQATVINLTQHSYFNLSATTEPILDHTLELNAMYYLPVDSTLIPTGKFFDVEGTPFEFRRPKEIGKEINADHYQLERGGGYDHCFVLGWDDGSLQLAGTLSHPGSGRIMDVLTTEPGIQLYTGNFLNGVEGKGANVYGYRSGVCLETQHFPDSPNQDQFPSTVLQPGEIYNSTTIYSFKTDAESAE